MASPIKIDPSNEGKFTEFCRRHGYKGVTKACIEEGKRSKNPKTRKRAVFAENAKYKWNKGGK